MHTIICQFKVVIIKLWRRILHVSSHQDRRLLESRTAFFLTLLWCVLFHMGSPQANAETPPPQDKKNESKKSTSKEDLKTPPVVEGPDAKNALATTAPVRYVHQWLPMPKIIATPIDSLNTLTLTPKAGRMMVVFFLASWCEPCQDLTGKLVSMSSTLSSLPIDFYYIFTHDATDDAKGFMAEHKIPYGYLAELDTLKNFNNPELPSIYIADNKGWLLTRFLKATPQDADETKRIIRLLTAF